MKQIPIKNISFLRRLDALAESLYKYPHSAVGLPKPDLTFATLREYQNDENFVGYPKEHNYRDYSGNIPLKRIFLFNFVIFFIFRIHQGIKSYSCSYNSLISFDYFTIFFYNSR